MNTENRDRVIKREQREEKNPLGIKVIGLCVIVLILVMVISAVVSGLSGISVTDISSEKAEGALIYDSLPDSIRNIEAFSSGTVLLTDTSVDYIDSSGRKIASNSHMYSQPVMKVGKSTVLLYDKGGTAFRIEKNSSIYNNYTVNSTITTAAVGVKGNYAYVLNEDAGYQSHLYVYSYQGKKQFEWGSASDYCLTTALSDNGKSIAVSMISVENGEYVSKVSLFNFKDEEAVYTASFTDSTVYHIEFINRNRLAVYTDNGVFVVDKQGNSSAVFECMPSELTHSSFCPGGLNAVAVAKHGNSKDSAINVFDRKHETLFTLDFDSEIFDVKASKNFVAVMLGDSISIFDKKSGNTGNIKVGEKCIDAVFSGRTLFVQTVSGIYSFDVDSDTDLTVKKEVSDEPKTSYDVTDSTISAEETTAEDAVSVTEAASEDNTTVISASAFG